MSMLNIRNLFFSYSDHPVITGLSCELEEGKLIALLGKNGCGKTTLFRCILGLLKNKTGEIVLNGKPIEEYSIKEMASVVAYIPQEHYPIFNYRVFEVMVLGLASGISVFSTPKEEDYQSALKVLEDLQVGYLMEKRYKELSGGERQIVLIARAILQGARFLIMDEPTANLDFGNQVKIMKYIKGLSRKGYTILLSTHNPEHALVYCDETLVMNNGMIEAQGPSKKVLTRELLQKIYDTDLILKEVEAENGSYLVLLPK